MRCLKNITYLFSNMFNVIKFGIETSTESQIIEYNLNVDIYLWFQLKTKKAFSSVDRSYKG